MADNIFTGAILLGVLAIEVHGLTLKNIRSFATSPCLDTGVTYLKNSAQNCGNTFSRATTRNSPSSATNDTGFIAPPAKATTTLALGLTMI